MNFIQQSTVGVLLVLVVLIALVLTDEHEVKTKNSKYTLKPIDLYAKMSKNLKII